MVQLAATGYGIDDNLYTTRPPSLFVYACSLVLCSLPQSHNMASPRPEWVEYATDREFGLGMIVADSSRLQLSFLLDSDSQVK